MKTRPLLMTLLAASGLGLVVALWSTSTPPTADSPAVASPAGTNAEAGVAPVTSSAPWSLAKPGSDETLSQEDPTRWQPERYAQVLAGTDIDGELLTDSAGNLVVSIGVKDFFDYFLSAVGEVTPERAMEEIHRQAALRLPPAALEQLSSLLSDYVSYQQLMVEYMQRPLVPADQQDYAYYAETMRDTYGQIRELRRQVFAPEAVEAFFALDETYSEYAVATMEVQADTTLTDEEKATRIDALKQTLPEQMRAADTEARARTAAVQSAREQFDQGAGITTLKETLGSLYSDDEITDMMATFREESAWRQRIDSYLRDRARILSSTLSDTDKAQQVEQLRSQRFEGLERIRAQTEEVIYEQTRGAT